METKKQTKVIGASIFFVVIALSMILSVPAASWTDGKYTNTLTIM